mmetsp:Transcript_21149/g.59169  ORF Transcript_21149/g.59169 Transcript_21149/m.59169 type:complete len:156 (-) Transcript_21149:232-699(-)
MVRSRVVPGKGKGKGVGKGTSVLAGKPYKEALESLTKTTVLQVADFDQRALQLLDIQDGKGKAAEAVAHLQKSVKELTRDHVANWKAYIYVLLRKYDEEAYKAMKGDAEAKKRQRDRPDKGDEEPEELKNFAFNPAAAEFVPGKVNHGDGPEEPR